MNYKFKQFLSKELHFSKKKNFFHFLDKNCFTPFFLYFTIKKNYQPYLIKIIIVKS